MLGDLFVSFGGKEVLKRFPQLSGYNIGYSHSQIRDGFKINIDEKGKYFIEFTFTNGKLCMKLDDIELHEINSINGKPVMQLHIKTNDKSQDTLDRFILLASMLIESDGQTPAFIVYDPNDEYIDIYMNSETKEVLKLPKFLTYYICNVEADISKDYKFAFDIMEREKTFAFEEKIEKFRENNKQLVNEMGVCLAAKTGCGETAREFYTLFNKTFSEKLPMLYFHHMDIMTAPKFMDDSVIPAANKLKNKLIANMSPSGSDDKTTFYDLPSKNNMQPYIQASKTNFGFADRNNPSYMLMSSNNTLILKAMTPNTILGRDQIKKAAELMDYLHDLSGVKFSVVFDISTSYAAVECKEANDTVMLRIDLYYKLFAKENCLETYGFKPLKDHTKEEILEVLRLNNSTYTDVASKYVSLNKGCLEPFKMIKKHFEIYGAELDPEFSVHYRTAM